MDHYRLVRCEVDQLWGRRSYCVPLDRDVNILVGRNASGKTTLLKLIHALLSCDFEILAEIPFESLRVDLRSFETNACLTVAARKIEGKLTVEIGDDSYPVETRRFPEGSGRWLLGGDDSLKVHRDLQQRISRLVPLAWLPVTRRLPVQGDDERARYEMMLTVRKMTESVDVCLEDLAIGLGKYRNRLASRMAEEFRIFQQAVLEAILFSSTTDTIESFKSIRPLGESDKQLLLDALDRSGLLSDSLRLKIDEHFRIANDALATVAKPSTARGLNNAYFVLPLIPRTGQLVQSARHLQERREMIYRRLNRYQELAQSFLDDKRIVLSTDGELVIAVREYPDRPMARSALSSGEKQLLILLTQALVSSDEPVVYMADEPELSLHVEWQEKLLGALVELAGDMQVIVATHSPDIVGAYRDCVVKLEGCIV